MNRHDTLLIASPDREERQLLRQILQEHYNLLEATNPSQTLFLLQQNTDCVASVLLCADSTEDPLFRLLTEAEHAELLEEIPWIVISGRGDPDFPGAAFSFGASDVIPVSYDSYAMLRRIGTIVELSLHKRHLESLVEEQEKALRHSNETMVDVLSSIIEYRSVESGQHILRIRRFTRILLEEVRRSCPEYKLRERDVTLITSASALHDIGKIAIPDAVLLKPGRLTPEEMELMRTHSAVGCQILNTLGDLGDPVYMRYARNICLYHHERWDGKGYPEGLSGEQIPICAQVVGLADCYDALTTKRVYKDAFSFSRAVNMILQGECGTFSPKLLECFKHVTDAFASLAQVYADGLSPRTEDPEMALPPPEQQRMDSIDRVRGKYQALVHYVGGLLIEMDMTRKLMHLVYNPYPEFSWLQNVTELDDLFRQLGEQMPHTKDREKMLRLLEQEIPDFLEKDLRRITRQLRFASEQDPLGSLYEVTLLRLNPIDPAQKTLAMLCRRITEEGSQSHCPERKAPSDDCTCLCRNDADLSLIRLGEHVQTLASYEPGQLRVQFHDRLMELILPEDRERVRQELRQAFLGGNMAETEFRVRDKQGRVRWFLGKSVLLLDADGTECLKINLTDISYARRAYDALNDKLRRYEIILTQTENTLFEWDIQSDSITFSETAGQIFGFTDFAGNFLSHLTQGSVFHPDDYPRFLEATRNLQNGSDYEMVEMRIAANKGQYLWCRIRASAVRSEEGSLRKVVGIIINIDEEKQAERRLQNRAERDSLTKLLNKQTARIRAERYLSSDPGKKQCAMLIIDLDNFKQVNDRYGHMFGDAILSRAAREIEKMFRLQDIVARIGGDEFLVLVRDTADRNLLTNRCNRLIRLFQNFFRDQKYDIDLSCSIGIALAPEHGTDYVELFHHADQALYLSKAQGKKRFAFYDPRENLFPTPVMQPTAISNRIDSDQQPGLADDTIVRYAFQKLYTAKDISTAVNQILETVGQQMNVSRVYVFENSDDNRFCNNTYEWCNLGIQPEIGILQNISYETDIPGYEENFNEDGIFYCPDIRVLPKGAYDILEPQGIKSMLQCAIREGGVFRGYIGFDECVEQRYWTEAQIRVLTYLSEMLSTFLLKHRKHQQALTQAEELRSILDNQNAWIYIIDPDSCELKYLNSKTKELAPDVRPGMRCHQALKGSPQRCAGCPALGIREKVNTSARMYNAQFKLDVLADATLIQWDGTESCLLTCREIPKL